jgi:hypothetical protein
MKSLIVSIVLMMLFLASVSAKDYSRMETVAEEQLLDPANNLGIISADVSINPQQVTVNRVTSIQETDAPTEIGAFLDGILGLYSSLVSAAPEAGDLLIVMKTNEPTATTFTCSRSWIIDVDPMNTDALEQLLYKVSTTLKRASG